MWCSILTGATRSLKRKQTHTRILASIYSICPSIYVYYFRKNLMNVPVCWCLVVCCTRIFSKWNVPFSLSKWNIWHAIDKIFFGNASSDFKWIVWKYERAVSISTHRDLLWYAIQCETHKITSDRLKLSSANRMTVSLFNHLSFSLLLFSKGNRSELIYYRKNYANSLLTGFSHFVSSKKQK